MSYTVTAFNSSTGQITLAFDGKQVNFPVPVHNGAFVSGTELTSLLDTYVANARAATAPTVTASNAATVQALVQQPSSDQLATAIKLQRDMLLRATDFTVIPGAPFTDAQVAAWVTYRQALRDLTKQPGFPTSFGWPVPPVVLTNARGTALTAVNGTPTAPLRVIW